MAEINCPVCSKMIERESFAVWVKHWGEDQWGSPEWRQFLISEVEDIHINREKLAEMELLCDKQTKYIKELEKQLEMLQKTLDLVEKYTPRPIILPQNGEVSK